MAIANDVPIVLMESRWHSFHEERPRMGEVFVGRCGVKVWDRLFQAREDGRVTYLDDASTVLGSPDAWFTHWMLVGEFSGESQ
jgi:hypothetical protein